MKNTNILNKIHLVYRCNYLRDTVYAKEEGPSMPKCLVFCQMNYTAEILSAILTSKVYLSEVIGKIDSPQTDNHDRTDCLQFILELVSSFK
jgi:hypothetical protein